MTEKATMTMKGKGMIGRRGLVAISWSRGKIGRRVVFKGCRNRERMLKLMAA